MALKYMLTIQQNHSNHPNMLPPLQCLIQLINAWYGVAVYILLSAARELAVDLFYFASFHIWMTIHIVCITMVTLMFVDVYPWRVLGPKYVFFTGLQWKYATLELFRTLLKLFVLLSSRFFHTHTHTSSFLSHILSSSYISFIALAIHAGPDPHRHALV